MRKALAFAVVLLAFQATAGTITSISPSSIQTKTGEYFVTVNGSGFSLGDVLVFDGYVGHFEVESTSIDSVGNITGWVPVPVVNNPDAYSLYVRSANGSSQAVTLNVYKPGRASLKLHLPELLVAAARSRLGTGIKYEVTTTGGDAATTTVNCDPASGSTFPFGNSYITCSAKDGLGGGDDGRINVSVVDQTNPSISVPASFEVKADLKEGAYVRFETSSFDEIDGELKPTCSRESGSLFPNGRTIVNCEAADFSLNPAYGSFTVFVHPIDPGVLGIRVPGDMTVAAEEKTGAVVYYEVSTYGSADPDPVVTCSKESGTWFATGYTKVSCLATDDFGQRAEGRFVVHVDTALMVAMDDVAAEATGPGGAEVNFDVKSDDWKSPFTCSPASGTLFAFGETAVECQSEEGDRRAIARFNVTVQDTVAPHINTVEAVAGAYDATRDATPVSVKVDAIDAADLAPRCTVASLTSDAGSADWKATADLTFEVREAGSYRVQVSCVDAAGNRSTETIPLAIAGSARRRDRNH